MRTTILVLLVVFMYSCADSNKIKIDRTEYEQIKGINLSEYPKPFTLINEDKLEKCKSGVLLGSDNHDYLVRNHDTNFESISHYIDCKECYNRNTIIPIK